MSTLVERLIDGDKAAIAIATEEYLEIHRICDGHKVPRKINDEKLTAAQRVEMLARCRKGYRE